MFSAASCQTVCSPRRYISVRPVVSSTISHYVGSRGISSGIWSVGAGTLPKQGRHVGASATQQPGAIVGELSECVTNKSLLRSSCFINGEWRGAGKQGNTYQVRTVDRIALVDQQIKNATSCPSMLSSYLPGCRHDNGCLSSASVLHYCALFARLFCLSMCSSRARHSGHSGH